MECTYYIISIGGVESNELYSGYNMFLQTHWLKGVIRIFFEVYFLYVKLFFFINFPILDNRLN